jgi:SNF2 family DNA or RNA helicase
MVDEKEGVKPGAQAPLNLSKNVLQMILTLRKICIHPLLILKDEKPATKYLKELLQARCITPQSLDNYDVSGKLRQLK